MRFGHYTVFDTPEENKHTQVYVEYDVPNNDNLDGATGTMILSDGSGDSSGGGGGDSRFSTCEVEVNFTLNGEPLTLDMGEIYLFNEYTPGPITGYDLGNVRYASNAITAPDKKTVKPLLFEGVAYITEASGQDSNNAYYDWNKEVAPVVTGDISIGSYGESPAVIVRGNGTITFDMVEGE